MKEISVFVDETGGQDGHSKYYVLTLIFHDQSLSLGSTMKNINRVSYLGI